MRGTPSGVVASSAAARGHPSMTRARRAVGVTVEPEDRRELRARRAHQLAAILLGPRQRLLVRQHHPALERLEAHGREEAAPRVALAAGAA